MNIYNGWLVVDKPKGMSSSFAVREIKRAVGKQNKVGHAGTLDPLAEGVLPIAIGEATKTTQYMMNAQKEYEFSIFWGEERSTYDAEGEVTVQGGHVPKPEEIEEALPQFIGNIMQAPPIYSALKVDGQRAYDLARAGKPVELAQRLITIESLELFNHDSEKKLSSFRVLCGKGTYVRSLAVDVARSLSTYGYVSYLKRTKVGNFLINDAIILANLDNLVHNILPITFGLGDILAVEVTTEQVIRIKMGQKIFLEPYAEASIPAVQLLLDGVLQAIVCIENGVCTSSRVFNL